jgi:hypothetical protein
VQDLQLLSYVLTAALPAFPGMLRNARRRW